MVTELSFSRTVKFGDNCNFTHVDAKYTDGQHTYTAFKVFKVSRQSANFRRLAGCICIPNVQPVNIRRKLGKLGVPA
jgi:hypothetical protein